MFIRVAFLLLFANTVFIDAVKIQNHLKNVGKRYLPVAAKGTIEMDWIHGRFDEKYLTYSDLPEDEIKKRKELTADMIMGAFHEAASSDNYLFTNSMVLIRTLVDDDLTAEVCADGKTLNSYQFLKYMSQSAAKYQRKVLQTWSQEILETDRDSLNMRLKFTIKDRDDNDVELVYDIQASLTFTHQSIGSVYSLTHVSVGGTCKAEGKVDSSKNEKTENVKESLEKHPTAELFFQLLSSEMYKNGPESVPTSWLPTLDPTTIKVTVCHPGVTDPVAYTEAQFQSWYKRFGQMWHPKIGAKDTYGIETTEMTSDSVTAKVTMKLQMGRKEDADVKEWNFVFTAKKNDDNTWKIAALDVQCTPDLKLKDDSLGKVREVVHKTMEETLSGLKSAKWYMAIDFVSQFAKDKDAVSVEYCDKGKTTRVELFNVDRSHAHEMNFLKFTIDGDVTLPATDSAKFRLVTTSESKTDNPGKEYIHAWDFDVKWDEMDQFYYVEKLTISCQKEQRRRRNDLW